MFFFSFEFSPESQQPICKWDLFSHGVLVQVRFYFSWGLGVSEIFSSHCLDGTGSNSHLHYIWMDIHLTFQFPIYAFYFFMLFFYRNRRWKADREKGEGFELLILPVQMAEGLSSQFLQPFFTGRESPMLNGFGIGFHDSKFFLISARFLLYYDK